MISRFGLLLSLLILISAFAEINAERKHNARKVYLFKPLTMLLILVLAWIQGVPSSGMYSLLIFIGLILSLGGDVALMWPKDRFLVGLVFFLMAHVSYIGAFFNGMTGTLSIWNGIPFLSLSLVVFGLLHSRLVKLKIPVLIYNLVLGIMAWVAWERYLEHQGFLTLAAFGGALLFVLSDALLGWDRFRNPVPQRHIMVLGTYFTAQWLFALSSGQAINSTS